VLLERSRWLKEHVGEFRIRHVPITYVHQHEKWGKIMGDVAMQI
jgi:hypothetical protein